MKNQEAILKKLGIDRLNEMQEEAISAINGTGDVLLISPTGSGKTLAFLLPLIDAVDRNLEAVQVMIVVPSRELAIQIEQVLRSLGSGLKCNAVYGGQSFNKDKINLQHPPSILIGTPGRIADHIRRRSFNTDRILSLVLDEFDKSLEIGFENEMSQIVRALPALKKRVLTSATRSSIPDFVGCKQVVVLDFSGKENSKLALRIVLSPGKDKLETLVKLLRSLENQPGIVFLNFKDSINRVSDYLKAQGIAHGCFYGGLEQNDRERTLIKFRNGSIQLILATDLAARGLDVPEIRFIIHYQLPVHEQEFIHRNGRTARMKSDGTAFILKYEQEKLPDFIPEAPVYEPPVAPVTTALNFVTLMVSGGRKDKISKGDIAGFVMKQGGLSKEQVGMIELKQECAFVGVDANVSEQLIDKLDGLKIKGRKVRVKLV